MALTPNNPRKRLEYALRPELQSDAIPKSRASSHAPHRRVDFIGAVANVVVNLMGLESDPDIDNALAALLDSLMSLQHKDWTSSIERLGSLLPEHHPAETLIPWIARELRRLDAAVEAGQAQQDDFYAAYHQLRTKAPAIAQWAKETRTDIGRVNLAQAFEAISTYEFKEVARVPQGEVVYTFPDGWTVQGLRSPAALKAEGEIMQHCVGSYCDAVREGDSRIFSLRDPAGRPHVTLEWHVGDTVTPGARWEAYRAMSDDEFLRHPELVRVGYIAQVFGKQNEPPAERYQPYMQEFIRERMNGDARGLMWVGVKDFRGQDLRGADFDFMTITDAIFDGADLSGSRWNDTTIERSSFHEARLEEAEFTGSRLVDIDFTDAYLYDASFDQVETQPSFAPKYVRFSGANLTGASFLGARLDAAMGLNRAKITNVKWDDDTRWPESFDQARLPEFVGA